MLRPFEYVAPATTAEAVALCRTEGPGVRLLAGGTALLLALERGQTTATTVIDLKRLVNLAGIEVTAEGELKIGALATLSELIASDLARDLAPVLAQTARQMATPQVRNLGTVGGNIASGLAAADLVVALLALRAEVLLATPEGEQRLELGRFLASARMSGPHHDGLLTAVLIPTTAGRASYQKLMVRRAADVPLANVAVRVQMQAGHIVEARIVAGGCEGRPMRLREAEAALHGKPPTAELMELAAHVAATTAPQPADGRASSAYRQRMVGVLTRRALHHVTGSP